MRGTASFLKRFWKDPGGATTLEIVIILAIIVVGLAGAVVLLDGLDILAKNGF